MSTTFGRGLAALFTLVAVPALAQVAVPAPGASPASMPSRRRACLRVGVLANAPWLVENTKGGSGDAWSGPAWVLANEYAKRLGVKLEAVPVSHETEGSRCSRRTRSTFR
jgi:polar amino acid transport system substrate-binding protein